MWDCADSKSRDLLVASDISPLEVSIVNKPSEFPEIIAYVSWLSSASLSLDEFASLKSWIMAVTAIFSATETVTLLKEGSLLSASSALKSTPPIFKIRLSEIALTLRKSPLKYLLKRSPSSPAESGKLESSSQWPISSSNTAFSKLVDCLRDESIRISFRAEI